MKWIFLRGLAREAEHWGDFPKQFLDSKLADDVFLIDAPGLGTKYEQSSPVSISQYVSAMRPEFLTLRRQYSGPWGVLAISMGAMVAMEWMKRHPQDFFCSVLINTSASNFSTPFDRLSPKTMKKLSKIFVFNEPVKNEKTIFDLTTHMSHQNENDILKRHVEIAEKRPISRANFLSQLFAAARFKAPKSISVPILFLISKKDQLASAKCGERLAKHLKAYTEFHEEAGHDLPLDDPSWIIEKTQSFLKDETIFSEEAFKG